MHMPSQWLQRFFCQINQKCKPSILLSSVISAVGLQEGWPSHLRVYLWRGSNRNSRTLEAGLHGIDKSHINEKAFSNLPFDDTEVNGCIHIDFTDQFQT